MRRTGTIERWCCKCGWSKDGIESPRGLSVVDELHRAARHSRHYTVLVRYPRAFDHAVSVAVTTERWTCSCNWSADIAPGTIRDHHRQVTAKSTNTTTSAVETVAPPTSAGVTPDAQRRSSRVVHQKKGARLPTPSNTPSSARSAGTSQHPNHRLQRVGEVEKWRCSCGWLSQIAVEQRPLAGGPAPKGYMAKRIGKIHAAALAQQATKIGVDPAHHVMLRLVERWKCPCGWSDAVDPGTQQQAHDFANRKVNGFSIRAASPHALQSMSPTHWRCSCGWIGAASNARDAETSHTRSKERERQAQVTRTLRDAEAEARQQITRPTPPNPGANTPTELLKQKPVRRATAPGATTQGSGPPAHPTLSDDCTEGRKANPERKPDVPGLRHVRLQLRLRMTAILPFGPFRWLGSPRADRRAPGMTRQP